MYIRIYNHVGFMVNVSLRLNHKMISLAHVACHLNRAGHFYSPGMRSYYYLIPLACVLAVWSALHAYCHYSHAFFYTA